jgi:hypothetical protein
LKNLVTDIQAVGDHVSQLFDDANIPTLPISAVNVNYKKADESIVSLDAYLKDLLKIYKL